MGVRSTLTVSREHVERCLTQLRFDLLSSDVLSAILECLCEYDNFKIVDGDEAEDDHLLAQTIGAVDE